MEAHNDAVASIATQVASFYSRKEPFRIYHGSTNSTRKSQHKANQMISTAHLTNVLSVDTSTKTALVEPNVPMDSLVEETLKFGLLPPVVMEFPGITVGGGFAGTAGESSSFKYGFFDRIVNWIEMVTADGRVVRASKEENEDLFFGAASSFGTLGVTTLLEAQLIKAEPYVDLTYVPINSITSALTEIETATSDPTVNYVDGMMYSLNHGVICIGRLSPNPSHRIQQFTRRHDPWFYMHVEKLLSRTHQSSSKIQESIPTVDYLFRYDRGGFWVAKYSYKYFLTPFNRITRYILDNFMHTRVMYHALHKSGLSSQYIIQDVAIPFPQTLEFMSYLSTNFGHYPLWLCPLKTSTSSSHNPGSTSGSIVKTNHSMPPTMLNFGVWGPGPSTRSEFITWNRKFEKKVHELGGQKWLYAHTYYTPEEFEEIYNTAEYNALREKWNATHLPSVYDKVRVGEEDRRRGREGLLGAVIGVLMGIWPFMGLYGVWCAWRGGDYLLPKGGKSNGEEKTKKTK